VSERLSAPSSAGRRRTVRRIGLALAVATVSTGLAALAGGWSELRFSAARQRADRVFTGTWRAWWSGTSFTPHEGSTQVPLDLAALGSERPQTGSTLDLPLRADPGHRVRVRVSQLESDDDDPPVLEVSLNGGPPARIVTERGKGLPLEEIEIGHLAEYVVDVPGHTLCGNQTVRVEAIRGQWLGIARIDVNLVPPAVCGVWRPLAALAAVLALGALGTLAAARAPRSPERRGGRFTVARVVLTVASFAVALGCAEGLLRVLTPGSRPLRQLLGVGEEVIGITRRRAGADVLRWLRGHRCAPQPCSVWSDGFRLNRDGLHTHNYEVAKAPGVHRLLGIGDSFMFSGGPVPYEDQFFVRLSRWVANAEPTGRWESINLGLSCLGVPSELAVLRHEGLRLEPDLIVWALYLGNDITDEEAGAPFLPPALAADIPAPQETANAWRTTPALLLPRLAGRLLRIVREEPQLLVPSCDASSAQTESPAAAECGHLETPEVPFDPLAKLTSDAAFARYERSRLYVMYRPAVRESLAGRVALLVERMAAAQRLVGSRRLLVVLLPDEYHVSPAARQRALAAAPELAGEALDFEYPHRAVAEGLDGLGFAVLDLDPAFRAAAAAGEALYAPNDGHLSVAGNHLAAEAIAAELRRLGWIAADHPPLPAGR
jgi:hypothetical protein